jgi:hypothetical protein
MNSTNYETVIMKCIEHLNASSLCSQITLLVTLFTDHLSVACA